MELKRRSFEPVLGTPLEAIIAIDGNRAPFKGLTSGGWDVAGLVSQGTQDVWLVARGWMLTDLELVPVTDLTPFDEGWLRQVQERRGG